MEQDNNIINNKRNKFKKNTTTSQISNTSVNNTSISTPNMSIMNSDQNKPNIMKQNILSENNNINDNKKISSNSPNKNKKSNIPFRKNKNNKILINSNSLKNKNNNDNLNELNNSFESKNSNNIINSKRRSFDGSNSNLFSNNLLKNNFIRKQTLDNIGIIPYKNKKYNFSIKNTNLSMDFNNNDNNIKRNNIRTISNKINYSGEKGKLDIKNKNKLNFYSINSFNASKISWSKEKKENSIPHNINRRTMYNLKKFNNKKNSSFYKSHFYKDKKIVIHPEKYEEFKHFSPLVKKDKSKPRSLKIKKDFKINYLKKRNNNSIIIKKINNINNENVDQKDLSNQNNINYLNNKLDNQIQNNRDKNKNNEININNNNISKLPLIEDNKINKNNINKIDLNNNNTNNDNNNNNIDKNMNIINDNVNKQKQTGKDKEDMSPNIKTKKLKKQISKSFQDFNQVLENVVDIPSVTLKNLRLTKKIQEDLEGLIDNNHCVYCLKRVIQPITLSCDHELCLACAEEIISLYKFTHIPNIENSFIKCPKCKKKSNIINNDLNNMLRLNWLPPKKQEQLDLKNPVEAQKILEKKLQYCEICPNNKYIRDLAEFECLNCDIILCYECRVRHLSNPRHQDHKIIPYTKIVQEKAELTMCDKHREPTKLFCETCMKPICVICAQYDAGHENHKINTIKNILDNQAIELTGNIRVCEGHIKIIEELIGQMIYSKQKIEEEKKLFINNLNKTIDNLFNLINKKKEELANNVNNLFQNKLETLENKLKNFTLIKNRYEYFRNLICDRDIDIIDRVLQIKRFNKIIFKIENLGYLNPSNFNKSFSQSLFVNEPSKDIEKILNKYSFLPITDITIENLIKIFNKSNIIKKELIYKDFIIILPKIKSGVLLYSTLNNEISTIKFHKNCDNKGPTLTIVKTVDGHIFGGYNPRSWVSESMYNECDNSFIFSLSDGKNIKPVKCPLKEYKKSTAIYQNEELNSPGWGEVSEADLFISYKNLANSYSNLGRCYKAPKNVEPNCFLAGKPTNWEIELVEVYAVEIVSDEEYYKIMLN